MHFLKDKKTVVSLQGLFICEVQSSQNRKAKFDRTVIILTAMFTLIVI